METIAYEIKRILEMSLLVQWLRLLASTAGGMGLIPGQGTKIPHTVGSKKEKKKWGPGSQGALNVVQGYLPLTDPVSTFF